ncbi:helix-turn-helix transcriptional regulator [Nocardioides sp. SYSU DS0651]|uniref:helix-turn-helix transcriptional regulator n=1 Tax=Nocardioides sp. SYSU DS0651 TaxID=3415955 RepID=UPI003F4C3C1F
MNSADPAARLLRLLALLQARRRWSPADLAARLEVSSRTLRRDLQRLEQLDYRVERKPGPGGYYALGRGARIPPLLFDDEEVVALVAGLRMLEEQASDDAAARALVKLRQVLPGRLSATAGAVIAATQTARPAGGDAEPAQDPRLDLELLKHLAHAGAEALVVRFDYRDQVDRESAREVDSVLCVQLRGRWYVVGFDRDRQEWRTFRMDRISGVRLGRPASRRELPFGDVAAWFASDFGRSPQRPLS